MSLLARSKDSYETARLELSYRLHAEIAAEANRRFVEYRFRQEGGSGMSVLTEFGTRYEPKLDDFIQSYPSDTNRIVDLVRRRPEWWSEVVRSAGRIVEAVVSRPGEIEWSYDAKHSEIHAMIVEGRPDGDRPGLRFSQLLDPTEEHFWYALWDDAEVSWTGERTVVSGRDALGVQVKTISWGYSPLLFKEFGTAMEGTTDHQLLVDAKTGVILRMSARLDGREYRVLESVSVSFDAEIPEAEFANPVPEAEWRKRTGT